MDLTVTLKELLQHGRTWLVNHLSQLERVLDHLYEGKLITHEDRDRVNAESIDSDKNRKLFNILESKSLKSKSKAKFLNAVTESEQDHILAFLERTEFTLKAEKIVEAKFCEHGDRDNDECLALSKVVSCIMDITKPPQSLNDDPTEVEVLIKKAITEVFERADIIWDETEGLFTVINIANKTFDKKNKMQAADTEEESEGIGPSSVASEEETHEKPMEVDDWTAEDVQKWLRQIGLHEEAIADFAMQAIDGFALLELNEKDLSKSEDFPNIKVGPKKRILRNLTELRQGNVPTISSLEIVEATASESDFLLLQRLKTLKTDTENAVTRLEDERMQLRDETIDEYRVNSIKQRNSTIDEHWVTLDFYFGAQEEGIPKHIDPKSDEACKIRRRQMRTLGASSFRTIFALKTQPDGYKKQQKIQILCLENISTDRAVAMDYQVVIAACLALKATGRIEPQVKLQDVVTWSRKLYELRDTGSSFIFLEPYLFYVLFNWPRKESKSRVSPKVLQEVLHQWREAYYNKWPRQRNIDRPYKKKYPTIFFLSYGSELSSVVSYHEIRGKDFHGQGDEFWKEPRVLRTLERFVGVLSSEGDSVSISVEYVKGNKDLVEIPTSFPIRDRKKFNKRVYFVIGFSWMGPKAFDIDLNDPTLVQEDLTYMAMDDVAGPKKDSNWTKQIEIQHKTHSTIMEQLVQINKHLNMINNLKDRKGQGQRLTKEQEQLLASESHFKHRRGHLNYERLKLVEKLKEDF